MVCVVVPTRMIYPKELSMCGKASVCVCVCLCVCLYLKEHHFETNSFLRKQSPLGHNNIRMSKTETKQKSPTCTMRAIPRSYVAVQVTLDVPGGSLRIFKLR